MEDELQKTLRAIRPLGAPLPAAAERLAKLAMPQGALGRLQDLALRLATIRGELRPDVSRRAIAVCAGDHGVVAQGVTNYPQSVTQGMLLDFLDGGAGVNALASVSGTDVFVADFGVKTVPPAVAAWDHFRDCSVGRGTDDLAVGPAMSRAAAVAAVVNGVRFAEELIDSGYACIGLGELGIGNTTPSAAVIAAFTGRAPAEVTGRGTGLSDLQLAHKVEVVERGLTVNRPDPSDALDVLAKVGGFEIGGLAGVCLACAAHRVPVVLDGLITTAGALVAQALAPASRDMMIAAHLSAEPGHRAALEHLALEPLLDLSLRLGEGTGAAVAMNLVASAAAILAQMKTFEEAGVPGRRSSDS